MFGRGSWAIFGLATESLEAFKTNLEDRTLMLALSQLAASAVTRQFSADTLGFNPFGAPRLDEQHAIPLENQEYLARFATSDREAPDASQPPAAVLDSEAYGFGLKRFQVHTLLPWYGLWAVSNEWKDVGDLASIKEQRSYTLLDRPYRLLQAIDKKSVDQETLGVTAAVRKQVPVLLDFSEGRVYIESGNKKLLHAITERLAHLGAKVIPVAWTYSLPNWPSAILNKLYDNTQCQSDFTRRADEATRFKPGEIEKLEDRELESIVKTYFSITELPGELWAGISGPAQIRLHDAGPPIGVKAPTSATTLLNVTGEARIVSGTLTFQERISYIAKSGGERTFRKDMLRFALNDRINLSEAGAAMLRGFDVPAFRKDIQREIRRTKQVPAIDQFWGNWLHELSKAVRAIEASFREVLNLNGDVKAGIQPMQLPAKDEEPELVTQ
jgi:hypothetical protein